MDSSTPSFAIATNASSSPQQLDSLSHHEDEAIRRLVAGHPRTARSTLRILYTDASPLVRAGVAGNRNTPLPIRERMSVQDPDAYVRRRAAGTLPVPETKTPLPADY